MPVPLRENSELKHYSDASLLETVLEIRTLPGSKHESDPHFRSDGHFCHFT